ncbi:hypothetical protein Tco_0577211, partial [Tanacetum coccineum]
MHNPIANLILENALTRYPKVNKSPHFIVSDTSIYVCMLSEHHAYIPTIIGIPAEYVENVHVHTNTV